MIKILWCTHNECNMWCIEGATWYDDPPPFEPDDTTLSFKQRLCPDHVIVEGEVNVTGTVGENYYEEVEMKKVLVEYCLDKTCAATKLHADPDEEWRVSVTRTNMIHDGTANSMMTAGGFCPEHKKEVA